MMVLLHLHLLRHLLLLLLLLPAAAGASMAPLNNPCVDAAGPWASQPWCDHTLGQADRVSDMLSRMTLTEKIQQLDTQAPQIDSLGLNAYSTLSVRSCVCVGRVRRRKRRWRR